MGCNMGLNFLSLWTSSTGYVRLGKHLILRISLARLHAIWSTHIGSEFYKEILAATCEI